MGDSWGQPVNQGWVNIQKRTFTKWCNTHLSEKNMKLNNLETDFADGILLCTLLEQISSKNVGIINKKPKIRAQRLENVGSALRFLKDEGIKLVAIGPEDIIDGSTKLILGLIWTIILRYQIIKVAVGAGSAKQDLVAWVRKQIPEYNITNFKENWQDGKALCALANSLEPGILDLSKLHNRTPLECARTGIEAAEKDLAIPSILQPEDLISPDIDELSVMTYISYFRDYEKEKLKISDTAALVSNPLKHIPSPGLQKAEVNEQPINVSPIPSPATIQSPSQSPLKITPTTSDKSLPTSALASPPSPIPPISVAPTTSTNSVTALEDWTVDDVIKWMSRLKLSQNYDEILRENHVNGSVLLTMKTKEDWKELGVTKFGDLRILANAPVSNTNSSIASTLQPTTSPTATAVTGANNRLASTEGLDDVVYKPIIKLIGPDYRTPFSCHHHMLKDLPSLLTGVPDIPFIIEECVRVAESRLQHLPSHIPSLSADEALAIAAYSYDLGTMDVEKNLYHTLNRLLRERNPAKLDKLKPFLSYLMRGLAKLPPLQVTVFRGIPSSSMKMIQESYRTGVSVHWSGFTSATNNINNAKNFANTNGIILRIKVLTGRSIKYYSTIPAEDEVLLSPNIKLLVTSSALLENDGFYYVDLVEQLSSPTFVY